MINNIRDAFIQMLKNSSWMDEESKIKAIEKVRTFFSPNKVKKSSRFPFCFKAEAIDEKIGYPEYLGSSNFTTLEQLYADVTSKLCFEFSLRNCR